MRNCMNLFVVDPCDFAGPTERDRSETSTTAVDISIYLKLLRSLQGRLASVHRLGAKLNPDFVRSHGDQRPVDDGRTAGMHACVAKVDVGILPLFLVGPGHTDRPTNQNTSYGETKGAPSVSLYWGGGGEGGRPREQIPKQMAKNKETRRISPTTMTTTTHGQDANTTTWTSSSSSSVTTRTSKWQGYCRV